MARASQPVARKRAVLHQSGAVFDQFLVIRCALMPRVPRQKSPAELNVPRERFKARCFARNDVELELVQEPRRQVLLNDLGATPEPDILTVRGFLRPLQRPLDPVGDEVDVVPPPSRPARAGDG